MTPGFSGFLAGFGKSCQNVWDLRVLEIRSCRSVRLKALQVIFQIFWFLLPVESSIGNRFWLEMSRNCIFRPQKSSSVRILSGYSSKSVQTCIHNVARQVLDIIQLPCEGYDHRIDASACNQKIVKNILTPNSTISFKNPEIAKFQKKPHQRQKYLWRRSMVQNGSPRSQLFENRIFVAGRNFWRQQNFHLWVWFWEISWFLPGRFVAALLVYLESSGWGDPFCTFNRSKSHFMCPCRLLWSFPVEKRNFRKISFFPKNAYFRASQKRDFKETEISPEFRCSSDWRCKIHLRILNFPNTPKVLPAEISGGNKSPR